MTTLKPSARRRRPPGWWRGYDAWSIGAQKGVYQPPYVVRDRGRWWRTLPLTAAPGEPSLTRFPGTLTRIRALAHLPSGVRRCADYLSRTRRAFRDLPLWPGPILPGQTCDQQYLDAAITAACQTGRDVRDLERAGDYLGAEFARTGFFARRNTFELEARWLLDAAFERGYTTK